MTSQIIYNSDLRTTAMHIQSGTNIETDAPTDNQGKGERFSPTDLVVTALGSCMVTTMAIKARTMNILLDGTRLDITKIMVSDPRRIGKIIAHVFFPPGLNLDDKQKEILEKTARTCPVERTLHPEVVLDMEFNW
ncbi:MAG: OsmC family protein [Chitinophagaceae bacterium]|nr:OsmC family protein [Chitinophagaceae bacterium]MDP1762922.1 OsmC family protein [Sediminibacterium sp.]MDP1812668.1 OsmC family protein [Sediminibacterium sp.]MDP3127555.1 OsmC family protein [Sediminibacterium sp.]MDP3665750.1 OsmC family protein [Sediminibacterium sp.]